jgi:hypothetical protein
MVDVYCLGVKQALDPAAARKLVEGAVEYAHRLGLASHADYRLAKDMFGAIDPADCRDEFAYGKDGKPLYVAGPAEPTADSRAIVSTLFQSCGPAGFDFICPVEGGDAEAR